MKEVVRGESPSVKGICVMNVREAFGNKDVCLAMAGKGMSVRVQCGGVSMKALVDTGCGANVMFKNAYDRVKEVNGKQNGCLGRLKGIGELEMPVIARFEGMIEIGSMGMKEDEFYVVEGINEKYDLLLGYKFLKNNGIVVHPEREMLEVRMEKGMNVKLYMEEDGQVNVKMVSGVEVYAVENVRLPRDSGSVVSVKVGWRKNVGMEESDKQDMFLMDGSEADYRVRRIGHVFDGIMDMDNPRVCVQVCGDVRKKKWRGINAGDRLGVMSTIVNLENSKYMSGCEVLSGSIGKNEWQYDTLKDRAKVNDKLSEWRKRKVYNLLWHRRAALSQGDEDMGTSKLPEFRIVLTDDTPIYQRPRHFPPPVAREIEEQCEELERVGVIEPSESAWNSPIVPVRKPDGKLRMCIDHRRVNEVTER